LATTKKVRVKKKYKDITQRVSPSQWSEIFSVPWPDSLRRLLGKMFEWNGYGDAETFTRGTWSQIPRANQLFIKHNLPFRIRTFTYGGSKPVDRRDQSWLSTQGLKLYTVTEVS